MANPSFSTIDEYLSLFSPAIQAILIQTRHTILDAAPGATEKISYQMPTFYLHGNLVHFAANKTHLGFYPSPSGIQAFATPLKSYTTSKGAVQFLYHEPIPYAIIADITRFRVQENLAKFESRKK